MGASQATGLGSAEAPEPPSRLGPSDAIPRADDRYYDAEGFAIDLSHKRYGPVSPLRQALDLAVYAAAKHLEWIEKEGSGPNYYGLTRDTHPEGESIWNRWWNEQLELCAATESLCRQVVAKASDQS